MPNYVKIPREIIYNKELGDKRIVIFSYLCSRRALDDTVAFSISELCHWSNLKPNSHEGKINQKYIEVLSALSSSEYFVEYPDFEKLLKDKHSPTEYHKVQLNIEKFDVQDNFGIIYFDEIEKILNFKRELKDKEIDLARMSASYILLLLSYLRVNINRNPNEPLCCYRRYAKISEDIGLSERYVSRVVDILSELNIVKYQEGKRKRIEISENKFQFITAPKIFADYRHFTKDKNGISRLDESYDYKVEIQNQLEKLEHSSTQKEK